MHNRCAYKEARVKKYDTKSFSTVSVVIPSVHQGALPLALTFPMRSTV